MSIQSEIVNSAENMLKTEFVPTANPGCANFVSAVVIPVLEKNGVSKKPINKNWVPDWYDAFFRIGIKDMVPGDLIIFDRTYDAVKPKGIGKEDDQTHIAVMVSKDEFIHYFSSGLRRDSIKNEWWGSRINTFLRVSDIPAPAQEPVNPVGEIDFWLDAKFGMKINGEERKFKAFAHDGKIKVIEVG